MNNGAHNTQSRSTVIAESGRRGGGRTGRGGGIQPSASAMIQTRSWRRRVTVRPPSVRVLGTAWPKEFPACTPAHSGRPRKHKLFLKGCQRAASARGGGGSTKLLVTVRYGTVQYSTARPYSSSVIVILDISFFLSSFCFVFVPVPCYGTSSARLAQARSCCYL